MKGWMIGKEKKMKMKEIVEKKKRKDKWLKRWEVEGSNGHTWVVALDINGNYGCSCPLWKFKRIVCHHINQIKEKYPEEENQISSYREELDKIMDI